MKRISLITFISLIAFFYLFSPKNAEAHILKTDGNIGAVLHIDPEDDPIAGSQAGFFFEFKDKQNKFTPQNCDCTFSIAENGKEIFSQPLFQNSANPSLDSASLFFTFSEKNVYQVKVVGKPNNPDVFQPFTLTYDVRVARETPNSASNSNQNQNSLSQTTSSNWFSTHIPHIIGGAIVGLFLIFALVKQLSKPKT